MKDKILVIALLASSGTFAADLFMPPEKAGDLLMDTFYQNPSASHLPPYDIVSMGEMKGYGIAFNATSKGKNSYVVDPKVASHSQSYYAPQCNSQKPKISECQNVCAAPPTYIWGGDGTYKQAEKRIEFNPFVNADYTQTIAKHPGLDCTGYVFAVYAVAGLKIDPELPINEESADKLTARSYMTNNKCFVPVKIEAGPFLKPGDLIAWKTHIVMVDQVGKDPFGVADFKKVDQCNYENVDPSKFTLVVSNSKGGIDLSTDEKVAVEKNMYVADHVKKLKSMSLTGVGVGISKMNFRDFAIYSTPVVMEIALAACRAKFGGDASTENIKVIRHKLVDRKIRSQTIEPNDPCLAKPNERVHVKGSECVGLRSIAATKR